MPSYLQSLHGPRCTHTSVRRTHAHTHTATETGSINVELFQDLVMNYTWAPLEEDDSVEGPESISLEAER